jgi:hypothetical protein
LSLPVKKKLSFHKNLHTIFSFVGRAYDVTSNLLIFLYFLSRGNTHRKSDESIELQPLKGQKTSKGVLRRMQRVKSDDLNADDEECPKEDKKEEKISSPIGAGLPLLQRLRLLKEKQVRFDAFLDVLLILILIYLVLSFLKLSLLFELSFV